MQRYKLQLEKNITYSLYKPKSFAVRFECGLLDVKGSVGVLEMDMILDSQNWMLFQATAGTDDSKISQQSSLGHIRLKCTWQMDQNKPKTLHQG